MRRVAGNGVDTAVSEHEPGPTWLTTGLAEHHQKGAALSGKLLTSMADACVDPFTNVRGIWNATTDFSEQISH
jgi:hypothetical protein